MLADYGNKSVEHLGEVKIAAMKIYEGRMHKNKIFRFTIKMEISSSFHFFAEYIMREEKWSSSVNDAWYFNPQGKYAPIASNLIRR